MKPQMKIFLLISLVVFCILAIVKCQEETLSADEEEIEFKVKSATERKLVTQNPTFRSILKESARHGTETKKRNFAHPTLGYVTPWNSKGYEIAKKFACKFDFVSPTWFQIKHQSNRYVVTGGHDVNTEWINAVKSVNSAGTSETVCPHRLKRDDNGLPRQVKVVPRFLVEGWGLEAYQQLFSSDETMMNKFIDVVLKEIEKYNFDGMVLDAGYLNARAPWREYLLNFLKKLSSALHEKSLTFILVVPPYRGGSAEESLFNKDDFEVLHPYIDYFSLMTYDFSNPQHPGPSSPIEWALESITSLLPARQLGTPLSEKILMGINLYGNDFLDISGGGPIISDGILKLLKSKKPKINWDPNANEHFFQYKQGGSTHTVWFPTLMYLQKRFDMAHDAGCGLSFWELGQGMDYFYDLL